MANNTVSNYSSVSYTSQSIENEIIARGDVKTSRFSILGRSSREAQAFIQVYTQAIKEMEAEFKKVSDGQDPDKLKKLEVLNQNIESLQTLGRQKRIEVDRKVNTLILLIFKFDKKIDKAVSNFETLGSKVVEHHEATAKAQQAQKALEEFNKSPPQATTFTDTEICSQGKILQGCKTMRDLTIMKLTQSLGRLPNKMNLTINGQTITTKGQRSPNETPKEATQKLVNSGLREINKLYGDQPNETSLSNKAEALATFDNSKAEHLKPYNENHQLNPDNQDIMGLTLATKELAGKVIAPIYAQLGNYAKEHPGLKTSGLGIAHGPI